MERLKYLSGNFEKDNNFRLSTDSARPKYLTNDFIFNTNIRAKVGENKLKLIPRQFEDMGNLL